MHSGLCTLIGVREKPGGREKANRGKKEREGEEGEEEKEKRKRKEEKKKMHQAITAARLCQYKNSPPQAMPAAGFAILKGHFTIHLITKKTVALWVFLATASGMQFAAILFIPGLRLTIHKN